MKRVDLVLLCSVVFLTIFGLFMIYDASSVIAFRDFGDKYHYIKEQCVNAVLGLIAMGFFTFFDYKKFYQLSIGILLAAVVMLIAVFLPGIGIYALGAHRWINLGVTVLQPAEFIKLSLAIYLAAWFSTKERGRLPAFALLIGFVLLLVMLQPDMGTASIILFEAVVLYFLSGANILQFVLMVPVLGFGGLILILLAPYRLARLTSFMNVGSNLEGSSYHVKQVLIALGSGGLFGVGAGNSLQKFAYLPENVTDSIFAIIAEEFGFFGALGLVALFAIVMWRGFIIAARAKDNFGRLLAAGIICFLGIQAVINLASMTALMPLTGVPLPFISYGGSALIVDLGATGILLNISRQGHHV
ncbi:MAG TPA: putative lipid II flippase FtsW [Patescibacteria group bacterium]|nr:putative lipid II flippase FtsW [Patescibacteria group bacterium]